jgi:hypothetical protein
MQAVSSRALPLAEVAAASSDEIIAAMRLVAPDIAPKPALISPPAIESPVAVDPDHQKKTIFGWKPTPVMDCVSVAALVVSMLNEPTLAEYAIALAQQ